METRFKILQASACIHVKFRMQCESFTSRVKDSCQHGNSLENTPYLCMHCNFSHDVKGSQKYVAIPTHAM